MSITEGFGIVHCSVLLVFQTGPADAGASIETILQQQDTLVNRTVFIALVPVVVAFTFIVFVFYRAKRESFFKQKEAELKLSIAEGELKALRAQINPHFIFNCLNSIHHYMHQHDLANAGNYLVKFSQLIRYVLESSAHRMVPLAEEMEANKIYLQLEQLRMNQSLEFSIEADSDLNQEAIHIPPMMVQPFIENAVWHGLSAGGRVAVRFSKGDDRHIRCVIVDNGRGQRVKSNVDLTEQVRKTSMGISLMKERFETLNQRLQTQSGFVIRDRSDAEHGKEVILTLPFED